MNTYEEFLKGKSQIEVNAGFEPVYMPDFLYDFQRALTEWAVRKGRAAMFADCGLGKTPMQLVWAENVVRKTGGSVLIITPLSVSAQTQREGEKFGIEVHRDNAGKIKKGINVTNYERLHYYNPGDFTGIVCDESSAIKQFGGKRRKEVIEFMRHTPYRLLCSATAAPNDYIELGTHSEALGVMGQRDMLGTFFRTSDNMHMIFNKHGDFWNTHKWMFKAHAEETFWRWVCSWARALRKPSDLGFDDGNFILPPLNVEQTVVETEHLLPGELFPVVAKTLKEQREERRVTMQERCEIVAEKVDHQDPAVVWCHLNAEGDLLEKIIPDAVQIKGADSDEKKEEVFNDFAQGKIRVLVTKPKIGAFGMNWQHCHHMTFFPSHSFEQYYQGVRRCWRFGQKKPVKVDIITTKGEAGVTANLQKKAAAAEKMFEKLVSLMNKSLNIESGVEYKKKVEVPSWL